MAASITEIEEQLNAHYGNDLKAYTDNELEKTKIEIEQFKEKLSLINQENEAFFLEKKQALDAKELVKIMQDIQFQLTFQTGAYREYRGEKTFHFYS
jgi:biopolymer transport protein ExbD